MADDDIKLRFEAASKGASLELLLPVLKGIDLSSLFSNAKGAPFSTISTRENLFFDESVNVIVAFKTAALEEDVKSILPDLELKLAAHATEAVSSGSASGASTSGKYDLVSTSFHANEDAAVFTADGFVYVLWATSLHLARPTVRLQRAAIYFTTALNVHPDSSTSLNRQKEYLKAFEPLPSNVLEPLRWDPDLLQSEIYLTETRVTKVAPRTSLTQEATRPIRGTSKRAIPVIPAVFSRIRYSVVSDAVIASLHIESSRLIPGPVAVAIDSVDFQVATSRVQMLMDIQWPALLQPGDELVILYRLPTATGSGKDDKLLKEHISQVSIAIDASIQQELQSFVEIRVSWQTQVDLSLSHARPSYRWSRSLSVGSRRSSYLSGTTWSRPTSYEALVSKVDDQSATTFTFTGLQTVRQNQTFKLAIHCNNRCHRPRRFALVMLPNRRQRASKRVQNSGQNGDLNSRVFSRGLSDEARPPDILGLNADIRIGPFSPGACFQTSVEFYAVSTGVLRLGTMRIIDLESRQLVDVRELPDVIAVMN